MDEYRGTRTIIRWDVLKCAHAGRCVRALPSVFDVRNDPWVTPDGADLEAIQQAVAQCPSRALRVETIPSQVSE